MSINIGHRTGIKAANDLKYRMLDGAESNTASYSAFVQHSVEDICIAAFPLCICLLRNLVSFAPSLKNKKCNSMSIVYIIQFRLWTVDSKLLTDRQHHIIVFILSISFDCIGFKDFNYRTIRFYELSGQCLF